MIRITNLILLVLFLIGVFLNPAFAQENSKKTAIGARVSYMGLMGDKVFDANIELDATALYGLNLSYFISDRFSFEVSIERMKTDIDLEPGAVPALTGTCIGEIKQTPVMLTARMHSPPTSTLASYIGVGAGYYSNSFDKSGSVNTILTRYGVTGVNLEVEDGFGFHVNGGADFFLTKGRDVAFNIDLKYIWNSVDFKLSGPGGSIEDEFDMDAFVIGVGLKYYF